jgi:hypothetical protein
VHCTARVLLTALFVDTSEYTTWTKTRTMRNFARCSTSARKARARHGAAGLAPRTMLMRENYWPGARQKEAHRAYRKADPKRRIVDVWAGGLLNDFWVGGASLERASRRYLFRFGPSVGVDGSAASFLCYGECCYDKDFFRRHCGQRFQVSPLIPITLLTIRCIHVEQLLG